MIRWQYVTTRLLILAAVLLLISLGLGPVAGYVTIKGLEQATGAKVELGATHVGLFPPRIRYENVRIADPRDGKALRDAFRAGEVELELDGRALLHRRWVARHGRITGLQIGAKRDQSGHFADSAEELEPVSLSDKPGALAGLLGGISNHVKRQAQEAAFDLETVKQSQKIKSHWQTRYESLAKRAAKLEENVRRFKSTSREIENPLRDWDKINKTVGMVDETRAELKSILAEIDAIPDRFKADMTTLQQAKQVDLQRIDQYVPGNLGESKNFGVDLISEAVQQQIATIRDYWEGGRTIAGYTVVAPDSERNRGVDIDLLGSHRQPEILVRRCEVQGMMRADGNAYTVQGTVENLTPSPERLAEPMRAKLLLDGPQIVNVDYIRDRRTDTDIDRITLHWPQAESNQIRFGDDRQACVAVNGGRREVWVQMRSENGQIQGRFASRLTGVEISLDVDSKYDQFPATEAIRESLAGVDVVTIDAAFEGTWESMAMHMDTNLGDILRSAADEAIGRQIAVSKQQMQQKVDETFAKQNAELTAWFDKMQIGAQSLTAKADTLLQDLGKELLDGVDSSEVTIGRMNDFLKGRFR